LSTEIFGFFFATEDTNDTEATEKSKLVYMNVSLNKIVSLRYVMKNDAGDVIEDVMDRPSIQYIHGTGKIISALENAIEGMEAGEKRVFSISDPGLSENLHFDLVIDEIRDATPEEIQNGKPSCGPGCCC
jgi:FKBP-type peptidyl-prolyl cis-trans isomerase SlyD